MSINIKNFKTINSNGKMNISGRKTLQQINLIYSNKQYLTNVNEGISINGMPASIEKLGLKNNSHLGKNIKIIRERYSTQNNTIYIPDRLRISYIGGQTSGNNSILYAWSNKQNINYTKLKWNVLFADSNKQEIGDYWDIDLPDFTLYPNLYLNVIMLLNSWSENRKLISENIYNFNSKVKNKIYNNNFIYSTIDKNKSHSINLQATNTIDNINTKIIIGWEDWALPKSDLDYNDIILSISSVFFDENNINDNQFK